MAYIYFNNNPQRRADVGDCVIRAVSKAMDIPWESAYTDMVLHGYILGDMPSSNYVLNSYLRHNGFSKHIVPDTCPSCYTVEQFSKDHLKGTYILGTGTHVICVKDGDIYDAWDSSDEIPIYYYRKEVNE